jgi:hypothetical protein
MTLRDAPEKIMEPPGAPRPASESMFRVPPEMLHVPENVEEFEERVRLPGPVFSTVEEPESAPLSVSAVEEVTVARAALGRR